MPHALILGCGDLGGRTAQLLIADGYSATGVRRRPFVLPGGVALSLDLADPQAIEQLPRRADVVIVALTPSQRTPEAYRAAYLDLPRLGSRTVTAPHWVFVSSTAVYGEHQTTLPDRWIDETVLPAPDRFNGEVLLAAEQQLRAQVPCLTVVRCSPFKWSIGGGEVSLGAQVSRAWDINRWVGWRSWRKFAARPCACPCPSTFPCLLPHLPKP